MMKPKINNPNKQNKVVCEWTITHRHIHPKNTQNITKITTGKNLFGDDVNSKLPDMSFN